MERRRSVFLKLLFTNFMEKLSFKQNASFERTLEIINTNLLHISLCFWDKVRIYNFKSSFKLIFHFMSTFNDHLYYKITSYWHKPSIRAPLICSNPDLLSASLRNRRRMVGNTLVSQAFTSKFRGSFVHRFGFLPPLLLDSSSSGTINFGGPLSSIWS